MRRRGSSGPLRVHLIPAEPTLLQRIRTVIERRSQWTVTVGLTCRVPADADVVLIPGARCAECLGPDGHPTPHVAYGTSGYLDGCFLRGCVDYVKDPWEAEELEHRLSRFVGRDSFIVGDTRVRLEPGRLVSAEGSTELTAGEERILEVLVRRLGEPVPREALLYALWGISNGTSRLVDVYVSRLRHRIEEVLPPDAAPPRLLSVRGFGYTLEA